MGFFLLRRQILLYLNVGMKLGIVFGLVLVCTGLSAAEMRMWTSSDGSQTVEAELFRQEGDGVTLILRNGRSVKVPLEQLSEQDRSYVAEAGAAAESTGPEAVVAQGKLAKALDGKLVDEDGEAAQIEGNPEYYLIYYSASWCPPCRSFTPELVRFHRRVSRDGNVQFVLAPSDKSKEDALSYLSDYRMPWPSIDYDAYRSGKRAVPSNPNGSIPTMVLADRDGNVLLANSSSLPRDEFLKLAKDRIEGK